MTTITDVLSAAKLCHDIISTKEKYTSFFESIYAKFFTSREIKSALSTYIQRSAEKCAFIRTIASEKRIFLNDVFVSSDFKIGTKIYNESEILLTIINNRLLIIEGTAGSGKSTHAKHIYLEFFAGKLAGNFIPLFVEFREIDNFSNGIFDGITGHINSISNSSIDNIFKEKTNNKYIIILDGLDEASHADKTAIKKSIISALRSHRNINFVITTRPDIDDKHIFTDTAIRCSVCALTKEQTKSLVQRSKFAQYIIDKFLSEFEEIYYRNKNLLESPLLTTLILLTYSKSAEIPKTQALFYDLSYNALACHHDASKECFRRVLRTALDIMSFKKIFSALSFITLTESKTSFTKTDILQYISSSIKYSKESIVPELFLQDATESIPLLVYDAPYYTYIHRSFQEYFAALFAVMYNEDNKGDIVRACCYSQKNAPFTMASRFINDISPDVFEKYVLKYLLDNFFEETKNIKTNTEKLKTMIHGIAITFKENKSAHVNTILLTEDNIALIEACALKSMSIITIVQNAIDKLEFGYLQKLAESGTLEPYNIGQENTHTPHRYEIPIIRHAPSEELKKITQCIAKDILLELRKLRNNTDASSSQKKKLLAKFIK